MRDAGTPFDNVVVTATAREPVTNATLGIAVAAAGADAAVPAHRLVTVGDSLTHGVSSGAVFHTDLSWPAHWMAAGLGIAGFSVPDLRGSAGRPADQPGSPWVRQLEKRFGPDLSIVEKLELPLALQRPPRQERGLLGARRHGRKPPRTDVRYDNVGIYGWDLRDASRAHLGEQPGESHVDVRHRNRLPIAVGWCAFHIEHTHGLTLFAPTGTQEAMQPARVLTGPSKDSS